MSRPSAKRIPLSEMEDTWIGRGLSSAKRLVNERSRRMTVVWRFRSTDRKVGWKFFDDQRIDLAKGWERLIVWGATRRKNPNIRQISSHQLGWLLNNAALFFWLQPVWLFKIRPGRWRGRWFSSIFLEGVAKSYVRVLFFFSNHTMASIVVFLCLPITY